MAQNKLERLSPESFFLDSTQQLQETQEPTLWVGLKSYLLLWDYPEELYRDKRSILFFPNVSNKEKKFHNINNCGQRYIFFSSSLTKRKK